MTEHRHAGDLLKSALLNYRFAVEGAEGGSHDPSVMVEEASILARKLKAAGLMGHEPVLLAIRTAPPDLIGLLAIWEAGGVAVPIHAAAAPTTIRSVEAKTGARFWVRGGVLDDSDERPPARRPLLEGAALIIFTSGSTGQPKGVIIGHERFAAKIAVLKKLISLGPAAHVIMPLQLTFIFGLWVTLVTLDAGARLTLVSRFSAEALAQVMADGATALSAVPSMLRTLLAHRAPSTPALRLILSGGEGLGTTLSRSIADAYPNADLYDLYGLTETGSCDFCLLPGEIENGRGTIGNPTEHVAFRIADQGGAVAPGQVGELQIETPFAMLGYLDQPELTAASLADSRFFRTGDLARERLDGRVELVGRAKEIISRGGNKIAPAELDNLISSHPDVVAALCAGVPDARLGEAIHAVVIRRADAGLSEAELRSWLGERIERFKLPDEIEFVAELPTGATGKASRAALSASVSGRSALPVPEPHIDTTSF